MGIKNNNYSEKSRRCAEALALSSSAPANIKGDRSPNSKAGLFQSLAP
jgi:hypothetical protein